jgi:hypothetical protein
VAGAELALERGGDLRRRDHDLLRRGVHLALVGGEGHVAAGALEHAAVVVERARVAVEVAAGLELQAVHEDRGRDAAPVAPGGLHQRDVPRVQVAHRRHERDRALAREPRAQVGRGADEVHQKECSGAGKAFDFTAFT